MSVLSYNGVSLPFVKTDDISFEPVWSDDHADYLHTKKSVTVTSTLTPDIPGLLRVGETIHDALVRIAHALEQPRKDLRVSVGGRNILSATAATDVTNGPFPEVLSITRIDGDHAYLIRFRCTTHQNDCQGLSPSAQKPVISNRWEESVEITDDFRTRRIRVGKLVIRGGRDLNPDAFRYLATPPVPAGFLRVRSHYDLQSDGLALRYQFEDEEQFLMPPSPSVKADGSFRIVGEKGIWRYAECAVQLTGAVKTRKDELLAMGVAVAMAKLEGAGLITDSTTGRPILSATYSTRLYKNEVEVTLRGLLAPPTVSVVSELKSLAQAAGGVIGTVATLPVAGLLSLFSPSPDKPGKKPVQSVQPVKPHVPQFLDVFQATPFNSERGIPPDPGLRGSAGLLLIAAALNDPCLARTAAESSRNAPLVASAPNPTRALSGQAVTAESVPVPAATVSVVERLPTKKSNTYLTGGLYTDYTIDLLVSEDTHTSALPEQQEGGLTHFVQLAAPTLTMTATWTAERIGQPPAVPKKDLGDENAVYMKGQWNPGSLSELLPNGVDFVFRLSGRYEYGFKDPKKAKWGAAVPPWVMELMGLTPKPVIYDGPRLMDPADASFFARVISAALQVLQTGQPVSTADPALQRLYDWVQKGGRQ